MFVITCICLMVRFEPPKHMHIEVHAYIYIYIYTIARTRTYTLIHKRLDRVSKTQIMACNTYKQ